MAFAPADWRKFYRDRAWEPLEFEEMSQTAQQMNGEPRMMKFLRIIGQAFSGSDAKQRRTGNRALRCFAGHRVRDVPLCRAGRISACRPAKSFRVRVHPSEHSHVNGNW